MHSAGLPDYIFKISLQFLQGPTLDYKWEYRCIQYWNVYPFINCMFQAEERGHEVMEEVYELYAALVAVPGDECCFKSYNLVSSAAPSAPQPFQNHLLFSTEMKRSVGKRSHSRLYHVPILCGEQSCFIVSVYKLPLYKRSYTSSCTKVFPRFKK